MSARRASTSHHVRAPLTGALSLGFVMAASSLIGMPARALKVEDDGKLVWAASFGLTTDPIEPSDQTHYCAVFSAASRHLWEATNGSHHYARVDFYYNTSPPAGTRSDVTWRRGNGGPAAARPSAGELNGQVFMFDYLKTCSKRWFADGDELSAGAFCRDEDATCELGPCPSTGACVPYTQLRGSRCVDSSGESVPFNAEELGWVLAHETSHSVYDVRDEYIGDRNTDIVHRNFGVCEGTHAQQTSMMGAWGRRRWCDDKTHVASRPFVDVNGNPILDANGVPFMGSVGVHQNGVWEAVLQRSSLFGSAPLRYSTDQGYSNVPAYPSAPFQCVWHFADGEGPSQDALMLVDRSGSMSFVHPNIVSGPNALASASSAAVSYFNQARADRMVGISAFNANVSTVRAFAARGSTTLSSPNLTPSGLTDLCEAIRTGADIIADAYQNSSVDEPNGGQILLTDGRPTTSNCNGDDDVIDATLYACSRGVATSTIGFGDTDHELLRRIARQCGGQSSSLPETTSSGSSVPLPTPLQVQAGLAKSGKASRRLLQVASSDFAIQSTNETSFSVPVNSSELVVEWGGDGFVHEYMMEGGGEFSTPAHCGFDKLDFALVRPDGAVVTTGDRPVSGETSYLTKTIHVGAPMPGTWRARVTPQAEHKCRANAALPHSWGSYDPRLFVLANVRQEALIPRVRLERETAGRNEPVPIIAELSVPGGRFTNISVSARVSKGSFVQQVTMYDDGAHNDEAAGDGIYGGSFNASRATLAAGNYRIEVTLTSTASAAPVVVDDPITPGLPMLSVGAPALTTTVETNVILRNCRKTADGAASDECKPDRAIPLNHNDEHPCRISLTPGTSVSGLSVDTEGLIIGAAYPVRVSLGPDVEVTNVSATYNPSTRKGHVTFDAVAGPNAMVGAREVQIGYGRQQINSQACLAGWAAPGVTASCYSAQTSAACCSSGYSVVNGSGLPDILMQVLPPDPDCAFGHGMSDVIKTGGGNDVLSGGPGVDYLYGYGGDDVLLGGSENDEAYGGDGHDTIMGGSGNDFIVGADGHDWLFGEAGDDAIGAGDGNDTLFGGAGNDLLMGEAGNDVIYPGPGLDVIDGGFGDDVVQIRHACEYHVGKSMIGGPGTNTLILPGTLDEALVAGLLIAGFHNIIENDLSKAFESECAP